jgi:neutral ceramidase
VQTNFLYPEHPEQFDFSPVDPELTAIRVVTASGPKAVLLNFGCHPVTGGAERERSHNCVSADYPFHARATIERAWGCPALFCLGAAGDVVPMNRMGHSREQIGAALGNAVLLGERVFAASGRREGEAVIASRTLAMEVRTIVSTRGSGAELSYQDARKRLLALGGAGAGTPEEREFQERTRLAYRARLYPEDRHTVEVQFLRIGETVLVAMPFEVLSEISLKMKRAFPQSVLVSIANGYEGYLPFAYEYERGGYEASADSTHFEIGTADRLLDKVLGELKTF